jgi:uncharacterized protein (TIGR03083 family)
VATDPRTWIATLRESHDYLDSLVRPLTPEQVREQSYCRDWSVAQVLSHLGSGAEIALLMLPGALGEAEPVGREAFPPVWDKWNAKSPDEQAADGLVSDERQVRALEALTDEQLATVSLDFFGVMTLDAAGMVRMRLGEHVMHTWDVAVTVDPAATVQADAVELLVDNVPQFLAPRLGKPLAEPFSVRITTTDPARDYLLTSGDSVTVTDWPGVGGAAGDGVASANGVPHVTMTAEALLRLAYGRLDREHTPSSVSGEPEVLDKLRGIFPGF